MIHVTAVILAILASTAPTLARHTHHEYTARGAHPTPPPVILPPIPFPPLSPTVPLPRPPTDDDEPFTPR